MAHDVFISYASQNKAIADAVCARMEAKQIRCWIAPRDVLPGAHYGEALNDAIHASRVFVLVFSSYSNQSKHVPREVELAVTMGIPIVPFRIEAVEPSKSLHYFIKSIHWLDAVTPPMEKHLRGLAETVQVLLRSGKVADLGPSQETPAPASSTRSQAPLRWKLGAACLILIALGLGLWIWRDSLFAPAKTPEQITVIKSAALASPRRFLTPAMVLELVAEDLHSSQNPAARRYITLTHLWNDPTVELELLNKWQDGIYLVGLYLGKDKTLLMPVDKGKSLYSIDWPVGYLPAWDLFSAQDPYALFYDEHTNAELAEIARKVEKASGSRRPSIRADRFLYRLTELARDNPPWIKNRGPLPTENAGLLRSWKERPVGLGAAAADLGWPDTSHLIERIQNSDLLANKMGLRALAQNGHVSRAAWESQEWGLSPFQELARLDGCGTPELD